MSSGVAWANEPMRQSPRGRQGTGGGRTGTYTKRTPAEISHSSWGGGRNGGAFVVLGPLGLAAGDPLGVAQSRSKSARSLRRPQPRSDSSSRTVSL